MALWHIEHCDGDEEDLELHELLQALEDADGAFKAYANLHGRLPVSASVSSIDGRFRSDSDDRSCAEIPRIVRVDRAIDRPRPNSVSTALFKIQRNYHIDAVIETQARAASSKATASRRRPLKIPLRRCRARRVDRSNDSRGLVALQNTLDRPNRTENDQDTNLTNEKPLIDTANDGVHPSVDFSIELLRQSRRLVS